MLPGFWLPPVPAAVATNRTYTMAAAGTVTLEEGAVMGGAGSAVAEALNHAGIQKPLLQLGLPDEFIEHGDPARLLALQGLDAAGIEASVRGRFGAIVARAPVALKVVG